MIDLINYSENDNPNVPDADMATAGIFCYDSSFFDSYTNLGVGGVRIAVQIVACIAAVLGLTMAIMLWKTTRKVHGKCYHRTMGFFVLTCFLCMFITLILQTSDFCLDYEGLSHNCDLGWGGYAAIARYVPVQCRSSSMQYGFGANSLAVSGPIV